MQLVNRHENILTDDIFNYYLENASFIQKKVSKNCNILKLH